jgi:hypothetical protein
MKPSSDYALQQRGFPLRCLFRIIVYKAIEKPAPPAIVAHVVSIQSDNQCCISPAVTQMSLSRPTMNVAHQFGG